MGIFINQTELLIIATVVILSYVGICCLVYRKVSHDPHFELWVTTVERTVELNNSLGQGVVVRHKASGGKICKFFTDPAYVVPPILALIEPSTKYPQGLTVTISGAKDIEIECLVENERGN